MYQCDVFNSGYGGETRSGLEKSSLPLGQSRRTLAEAGCIYACFLALVKVSVAPPGLSRQPPSSSPTLPPFSRQTCLSKRSLKKYAAANAAAIVFLTRFKRSCGSIWLCNHQKEAYDWSDLYSCGFDPVMTLEKSCPIWPALVWVVRKCTTVSPCVQ